MNCSLKYVDVHGRIKHWILNATITVDAKLASVVAEV